MEKTLLLSILIDTEQVQHEVQKLNEKGDLHIAKYNNKIKER